MKRLSPLLIIILFWVVSFTNCKKDSGATIPVTVADSLPFENSDIKMSAVTDMPFNFSDIYFSDSLTGIAVTGDGKIYRTQNAGTDWKLQYKNVLPVNLHQILFINTQTGFVVGGNNGKDGTILNTTDGGIHWHPVLTKTDIEFVSVALNKAGEIFTIGNGLQNQMLKSDDAGESWDAITTPPVVLYKISFNQNFGYCAAQGSKLFHSSDNGASWQLDSFFNVINSSDVKFNNTGFCLAEYQKIFTTIDNGNSWSLSLNPEAGSPNLIETPSPNTCIAFGKGKYSGGDFGTWDGAVWLTKDAGKSWQGIEIGNIFFITASSFYSSKEGYVATPGKLIKVVLK